MTPQLLAQRFRDALLPDITNFLSLFSEIDSYETMVSKAISIERAQERHRPSRSSARVTFVSPRPDARPNRGGWRTGGRVFPRRGRCYNCDEPRHMAAQCPEPIIRAFNESTFTRSSNLRQRSNFVNFTADRGGAFFVVDVQVGDNVVDALIDCGSSSESSRWTSYRIQWQSTETT